MKYAIYDVLTTTTPVRIWDDKSEQYISAIYDTEAEANKAAEKLNAYLIESVYVVKPYAEEITLVLAKKEVELLIGICKTVIDFFEKSKKIEKMQLVQGISDKLTHYLK